MNGYKSASQSVTIWSAITTLLSLVLERIGVQITFEELDQIIFLVTQLFGLAGVIYGRMTADKQIK